VRQRRFVLLDRDGTINVEREYLSDPDELELYPNTLDGLRRLQGLGFGLVVVTNQSAIGRGFFDRERLEEIHLRLKDILGRGGVRLDGIFVCPHTPDDDCQCRKPQPGLALDAAKELGFEPAQAFVIGDKACDIGLGQRIGATTLLVRTGYGKEEIAQGKVNPDFVVADLAEAAQVIEVIWKKV
jgi:D-glycero-D-manno-heptose 1,7-bisphosphate phosphatase